MFTEEFKRQAAMEITTRIGCPVMCSFCPQVTLIGRFKEENPKDQKILTLEHFKTIIDKIPSWVDIHFSGMSEPFAVPKCGEMLKYARDKGHEICVYTTLVGAKKEDIDILWDVNWTSANRLCVHLPDDQEHFKAKVTDKYIEVLKYLMAKPNMQERLHERSVVLMTMSGKGLTDPKLIGIVPQGLGAFQPVTRAGNLSNENEIFEGQKVPKKTGAIYCNAAPDINHNVLLPNGDVVLCCMDYGMERKIGNLFKQSYESLFVSDEYNEILRLQNEEDNELMCRYCDCARKK